MMRPSRESFKGIGVGVGVAIGAEDFAFATRSTFLR